MMQSGAIRNRGADNIQLASTGKPPNAHSSSPKREMPAAYGMNKSETQATQCRIMVKVAETYRQSI